MTTDTTTKTTGETRQLASYLAGLRFEDIPEAVVARTEELFLDWISSALLTISKGIDGADDDTTAGCRRP